jgi:hypothetical protein
LVDLEELPDDAMLATFSGVGAVRGNRDADDVDSHHARAFQLFSKMSRHDIAGIIPSEVGPLAVTYGWYESAATGIPLVDAPCNGRAHPLSLMGSLGLHRFPEHLTTTTAVGGKANSRKRLELSIKASAVHAARIVRDAVARAGESLAVVRNPVPVSHARRHAAVGALRYAYCVGEALLSHTNEGVEVALESLSEVMRGNVIAQGIVHSSDLIEKNGFTVGTIVLDSKSEGRVHIPVCNEYMMVIKHGRTLAAFPDLVTVFDPKTVLPLGSPDVLPGKPVIVFAVPQSLLPLASTMKDRRLLRPVETLLKMRFPETGFLAALST